MHLSVRTLGLWAVGLAVPGALLVALLREAAVPVDIAVAERGPFELTLGADGVAEVRQLFEVAAPIAGTALRSPVAVGDRVEAGVTVVARVEPVQPALLDARARAQAEAGLREAEAALHVAEADLAQAEENAAYAVTQFERAQTLVERGAASVTRLEDASQRVALARATRAAAASRRDMAEGALERAEAVLQVPATPVLDGARACCVELRAPADGAVLDIATVSERPVAAGERLLSIGDPGNLHIRADLLSTAAVSLPEGALARIERWGGPDTLQARLARIEPAARTRVSALGIKEQRVDAIFELVSPSETHAGLGHNYAVFLRIVEWQTEDALLIPLSAAFRRGEEWQVFTVDDTMRARERPVMLGRHDGRMAIVLDGLAAGERVVTHPSDAVHDGARLRPRSER